MIDRHFDFDDQYFRSITVALARTLNKSIRWINYFEPLNDTDTGRQRVLIPFYTSLTGDERFVFDAFVDDVADKRVNMNTDQYQRGIITLTSFGSRSDEYANPNQYLSQKTDINGTMRRIISKVKAVPMNLTYDIEIQLATVNEVDKCSQKIMNFLYNYMFFNIDYFGIKLDVILKLPDDKTIEIVREVSMDSERKKTIKFSLDVHSYYPLFRIDADDLVTCDNDSDFDWGYLGVPRPSLDFEKSLKNYSDAFGTALPEGYGKTGKNKNRNQPSTIKRVYYQTFYNELERMNNVNNERNINLDPSHWNKETFNISPVQPGQSKNDINTQMLTTEEMTNLIREYIGINGYSGYEHLNNVIQYISINYSDIYDQDITEIVKELLKKK